MSKCVALPSGVQGQQGVAAHLPDLEEGGQEWWLL